LANQLIKNPTQRFAFKLNSHSWAIDVRVNRYCTYQRRIWKLHIAGTEAYSPSLLYYNLTILHVLMLIIDLYCNGESKVR